ncbi:hypothetical protein GCM10009755_02390 [Brevibacterium samyangense]|uniref:Uncharacterized protein n=1 Tax=Brevibacterium samyangense TaxID=366888 RepID=A0ABP5ELC6_9MICO
MSSPPPARFVSARASAVESGSPESGSSSARTARATSGAGTKYRRIDFGRDRMSAVTSSLRRPGTCQVKGAASVAGRESAGISTVTPSEREPGSKEYRSFADLPSGSSQFSG